MGGLVGSIFDLASGNPTEGEEQQFGSLGKNQIGTGESLVTPAAKYYENILSGDPSLIAQSLAPEISTGQSQVEQQRLGNANFGNRGGGTNASTQNAENSERGNIISLVGGLQQGAAGAAGSLGTQQESMGSSNVGAEARLAEANRKRQVGDVNGIAQGAAEIAAPFLSPAAAATQSASDITGTLNPEFAATRPGPEPGYTDWSGLDTSQPDLSIFS